MTVPEFTANNDIFTMACEDFSLQAYFFLQNTPIKTALKSPYSEGGCFMDNIEIRKLQLKGYGYKRIAKELSLSPNTVKSYIKRHPLDLDSESAEQLSVCLCCGKKLLHTPGKKKKKFCSVACKDKWKNTHSTQTAGKLRLICECCGEVFFAFPSRQTKYCSRACYDKVRCKNEK